MVELIITQEETKHLKGKGEIEEFLRDKIKTVQGISLLKLPRILKKGLSAGAPVIVEHRPGGIPVEWY